MSEQQKSPNRASAFWLVLIVHLVLGAALYSNYQDDSGKQAEKTELGKKP